jgi:hypothetical protein
MWMLMLILDADAIIHAECLRTFVQALLHLTLHARDAQIHTCTLPHSSLRTRAYPDFLNPRCTHPQKLSHSTWSCPRSHCTSTSLASSITLTRNANSTVLLASCTSATPSRRLRSNSRRYARFHTFWLASPIPVAGLYVKSRAARCVLIASLAAAGDTEEGSWME